MPGNHENKLLRALRGRNVQVTHGLAESLEQLAAEPAEFRAEVEQFLDGLISHYVLDGGNLVRLARRPDRALPGPGVRPGPRVLPVRPDHRRDRRVRPARPLPVGAGVPGQGDGALRPHPGARPRSGSTTRCAWTPAACSVAGSPRCATRSASSSPCRPSGSTTSRPSRSPPTPTPHAGPSRREPDVLDITDVTGSRVIETRYQKRIGVREENAAAALEVMSRFAIDPRWLLYLPPTMSPVATSTRPDLLEHPEQAFEAFRADGVDAVVCEEKHMGSRAVALVCRDLDAARARFGAPGEAIGAVWTRTGRPFFDAGADRRAARPGCATRVEQAGLFDELDTSWVLLDAELLPWSAKAEQLLRDQYAAVGAAARASLPAAVSALEQAAASGVDVDRRCSRGRGPGSTTPRRSPRPTGATAGRPTV